MSAGYSKRPLYKKLGLKEDVRAVVINAPDNYDELLAPLPDGIELQRELKKDCDFIHFFTTSRDELAAQFPQLKANIVKIGMIWISWPKKAAKVITDVDENVVREIGLANGVVDVKVAAVDQVWSGLKFVIRLQDR
jgi:hypothetical protein